MSNERLAVVTGTSSGIGAALATALLTGGWTVVGLARRPAALANAAYSHFIVDLSDTEALQKFVTRELSPLVASDRWRRVGLVNNAAVLGAMKSMLNLEPVALAKMFGVNVVAPIFLMGAVAQAVNDQTPLRIANISSGAATKGIPGLADYCASKAALRLAGMSLAAEVEQADWSGNTAIFSYEPGVVATAMQDVARAADPSEFPSHEFFQGIYDQDLLLQPQTVVAEIVEFLTSDPVEKFTELRHGTS